ncbi:MAG TPA: hypothetical protein VLB73_01970 [Patescibacteria group bacterium]|nr:hypothetical protein [Patescibacteria group bacterium]
MPEGSTSTEAQAQQTTAPLQERHVAGVGQAVRGEHGPRSHLSLLRTLMTPGGRQAIVDFIGSHRHVNREKRQSRQSEAARNIELEMAHQMGIRGQVSLSEGEAQKAGITDIASEKGQQQAREWLRIHNAPALRILEASEVAMMHRVSELAGGATHRFSLGPVNVDADRTRGEGESIVGAQPAVNVAVNSDGSVDVSMVMSDPRFAHGTGVVINRDGTYAFRDAPLHSNRDGQPAHPVQGAITGGVIVASARFRPRTTDESGRHTTNADIVVNGQSVVVDSGNGNINDKSVQEALQSSLSDTGALFISSRLFTPVSGRTMQVEVIEPGNGVMLSGHVVEQSLSDEKRLQEIQAAGGRPILGTARSLERLRQAGLPNTAERVVVVENQKIPLQASAEQARTLSSLSDAEFLAVTSIPRSDVDLQTPSEPNPQTATVDEKMMHDAGEFLDERRASQRTGQLSSEQEHDPAYLLWSLRGDLQITDESGKQLSGVEAANLIMRRSVAAVGGLEGDPANAMLTNALVTESGGTITTEEAQELADQLYGEGPKARGRNRLAEGDVRGYAGVLEEFGLDAEVAQQAAERQVELTSGVSDEQRNTRIHNLSTMTPDKAREEGETLLAGLPEDTPDWKRDALRALVEQQVAAAEKNGQTEETRTHFVERVQNGQVTVEELRELGLDVALTPRASSTPNKQ